MARDLYHYNVRAALERSSWEVVDDPLQIKRGAVRYEIDLGLQQLFAADKGPERIAVKVKSFIGRSPINEFHLAVGQYITYSVA